MFGLEHFWCGCILTWECTYQTSLDNGHSWFYNTNIGDSYWVGHYRWGWHCAICLWAASVWNNKRPCCSTMEWKLPLTKSTGLCGMYPHFILLGDSISSSWRKLESMQYYSLCRWRGRTCCLLYPILESFPFSHFAMKCTGFKTLSPACIFFLKWKDCIHIISWFSFKCNYYSQLYLSLLLTNGLGSFQSLIFNSLILGTQGIKLVEC